MSDSENPSNAEKLRKLLIDLFLLEPDEFRWDLKRQDVDTWDSLGVVSLAIGVEETFGYHLTPDEATGLASIEDIIQLLSSKGIEFER
jgi:acyl carrier protein